MDLKPLVSVIIPLYNSENSISATIESALGQTWTNIEIIIVDDGSTDQSINIVSGYEYDNVKLYRSTNNGACTARNIGLKHAKGKFIQFLDSDDLLSANKIELQVIALQNRINTVAICNTWRFSTNIETSECFDQAFVFSAQKPSDLFVKLWGGYGEPNMIQTSAWLIPKNLIADGWNEELKKDQDGEFFARVVMNADEIIYTPEAKNYYRINVSSHSISIQNKREHIESICTATKLKMNYLLLLDQSQPAQLAAATQYKFVAIEAWPKYRDITFEALKLCKQHGNSSFTPILGGRMVEFAKWLLGWKITKYLTFYLHHAKRHYNTK